MEIQRSGCNLAMLLPFFSQMQFVRKVEVFENGKAKMLAMPHIWIKSPRAKRSEKVIFDPSWDRHEIDGVFNVFTGFTIEPNPQSSCGRLLEHHASVGKQHTDVLAPHYNPTVAFCVVGVVQR